MRKSCPLLLSRAHNVHCICLFDFGHGSRFGSTCQLFFRIGFGTKPVNQPSFVAVFWRVLIIIIWLFCARHGRFHWTQHRRTSEQCAAYPRLLYSCCIVEKIQSQLTNKWNWTDLVIPLSDMFPWSILQLPRECASFESHKVLELCTGREAC